MANQPVAVPVTGNGDALCDTDLADNFRSSPLELRKHEQELESLKRKWEAIVSKSIKGPTRAIERSAFTAECTVTQSNEADSDDAVAADLTESVQAAKTWVGGVFGKVLNESPWARRMSNEDEQAREGIRESSRSSADRQPSDTDPFVSEIARNFGASAHGPGTAASRSQPEEFEGVASPSTDLRRNAATHGRTRSTFDVISNVAGGSWASLTTKITSVTASDAFNKSKLATLGLMDTVEQGLASALGPIEPAEQLSPSLNSVNKMRPIRSLSPSRDSLENNDPSRSGRRGSSEWSFDTDHDAAAVPQIRGYKRPSLTASRTAPSSKGRSSTHAPPPAIAEVDDEGGMRADDVSRSWAAW
ncbi:hypothetical protein OIO90_003287 [Microbotryomycetes sp. JL221]|nr:hypothetical protein OIO90_003287 [Microbotryomycetes sp. JL221]